MFLKLGQSPKLNFKYFFMTLLNKIKYRNILGFKKLRVEFRIYIY